MNAEQKAELKNLFRFLYATKIAPEKYSKVTSYDELNTLLDANPKDKEQVNETIEAYSEEELLSMAQELQDSQDQKVEIAKKGTKINKKKKFCKCGCEMLLKKEKGGVISYKCSCGCKMD